MLVSVQCHLSADKNQLARQQWMTWSLRSGLLLTCCCCCFVTIQQFFGPLHLPLGIWQVEGNLPVLCSLHSHRTHDYPVVLHVEGSLACAQVGMPTLALIALLLSQPTCNITTFLHEQKRTADLVTLHSLAYAV